MEPATGCICINSLITNFLNLIIYNLQSPMHILQQNLQTLCKERWRYFGVQGCRIKLWTKSVAVHMSGAVLCKKNFGQISENAVEQLQVPRNQRELTFATISLKERCTD